jgi:hypothetical protein
MKITSRALAEFIGMPITHQMRILAGQKRSSAIPALFQILYYQPARLAIRAYFASGNDPHVLTAATRNLQASSAPRHKVTNNERALDAFTSLQLAARKLRVHSASTITHVSHGVTIKTTADLAAVDSGVLGFHFMNFTGQEADADEARRVLEIAQWVHSQGGLTTSSKQYEFHDLAGAWTITGRAPRQSTIKNAKMNTRVISGLWSMV